MAERKNADMQSGKNCPTPSQQANKPSQAEGEFRQDEPNVQRASSSHLSGANVGEAGSARSSADSSIGSSRSSTSGARSNRGAFGMEPGSDGSSAARQAAEAGREVKGAAKELAGEASRQATRAASDARQAVSEQAANLQRQGAQFVSRQKDFVADEVDHVGSAVRQAAQKLHEEGDDRLGSYVDQAADGIECVGGYLRDRDSRQLVGDFETLARRRPELVYGGLFIAGLGIARFLKASSARRRREEEDEFLEQRDRWNDGLEETPEAYGMTGGEYDPYVASASYMASAVTSRYPEAEGEDRDVV